MVGERLPARRRHPFFAACSTGQHSTAPPKRLALVVTLGWHLAILTQGARGAARRGAARGHWHLAGRKWDTCLGKLLTYSSACRAPERSGCSAPSGLKGGGGGVDPSLVRRIRI